MALDKVIHFFIFFLCCLYFCKAQIEGEVRLTGMDLKIKSSGRLEIFLNGKWGTVSRQLTNTTVDLYLTYGKTVCYQNNHYNGDDSKVATGTVSQLNKVLKDGGLPYVINTSTSTLSASVYDLQCENRAGKNPRHVLRCSYTPADGSRNHDNDLAVICSKSASDSDHPFIGQVRLVSDLASEVNQGTLELYSGSAWGNVCYNGFDQTAANTACRQLGYTNAKSLSPSFKRSASTVWLDSVSCGFHSEQCLWHCLSKSAYKDLYDNKTKSCSGDSYVNVICDFEVSRRNATSPYVGNACQVPPYRGAGTSGGHPFATTHAGTDNSGNSKKTRYTRCSTSDKSSTDI